MVKFPFAKHLWHSARMTKIQNKNKTLFNLFPTCVNQVQLITLCMRWRRGLKQLRGAQQKGTEQSSDRTQPGNTVWSDKFSSSSSWNHSYVQWSGLSINDKQIHVKRLIPVQCKSRSTVKLLHVKGLQRNSWIQEKKKALLLVKCLIVPFIKLQFGDHLCNKWSFGQLLI